MELVRIAVLDAYDAVCTFMDNSAEESLNYWDDDLHEYLQGTASTFAFTVSADSEDSLYLVAGNKISFQYNKRDYYMNIVHVERDEEIVSVEAYSLNFELLNEQVGPYKAAAAMSLEEYLALFNSEKVLTVRRNEVSDRKIKHEWTGSSTILARLFSLATVFSAEVEFEPVLNKDHSLAEIVVNFYKEHTDSVQGIGKDREDIVLRYGASIYGVRKKTDIVELYTAIRPTGKDGLGIYDLEKTELDAEGEVEYQSVKGDGAIRAVQARDRFPSNLMNKKDGYILVDWSYETSNVNSLYGRALAELKKNCVPKVSYEVDGYFDIRIGDTVTIADEEYNPPLYLKARVSEQIRSFTDRTKCKTTFSNFTELQSQIDPALLAQVNALVEANRLYTCSIISDHGIVFKNSVGSTTLTALVMDGGKDVTDVMVIKWKKDGVDLPGGKSIVVQAADIMEKAVYRFEALDDEGSVKGVSEVTVTNVSDGTDGEDATLVRIESSRGTVFKNNSIATVLSVVVYHGSKRITDISTLRDVYGQNAFLEWSWQKLDEATFGVISSSDKMIGNNGFTLTISADEVDEKCTFMCELKN